MSFPGSPKVLRSGLALVDPQSGQVRRLIALQYNPDTLTRSLQVQGTGGEGGDRTEALRLKGPPIETIKLEAEIDATDQLEFPERNGVAVRVGIHPQLAALETIVYPASDDLIGGKALAGAGTIEILPLEATLTLFIWSRQRILPVRVTEFSITEEAFDPSLNPIRAKVALGMRVLSIDDLGADHRGASMFMTYLRRKEHLVSQVPGATLAGFGVGALS
jgi:hypothetical protein